MQVLAHQFFDGKLERNLVVEFLVEGSGAAKRAGASEIAAATTLVTPLAAAAAGFAVEHGQLRVEALQHHFRRVGVGAVLLLPLPRL